MRSALYSLCVVIVFPVKRSLLRSFLFLSPSVSKFLCQWPCSLVTEPLHPAPSIVSQWVSGLAQGPYLLSISSSRSPLHPPSDTKMIKQEWPSSLRWSVVKDGSVSVNISLGSKFKFVHFMRRNIFWDPNFIVGSRSVGAKLLFSSPWPLIQVASEAGYCNIVFLVFCGSGRDLASGRDEIQRISLKYLTSCLGVLSVQSCQTRPVACVPQPLT